MQGKYLTTVNKHLALANDAFMLTVNEGKRQNDAKVSGFADTEDGC